MAQAPNPNPTLTDNEGNQIETGLSDTFSKTLALYNGYELFRITKFYRDRIEQAIEEDVETVISVLTRKEYFSQEEYQKLTELTHSGQRRRSSKLLLNLVLGKGSRVQRVMWESFVEMKHTLPKLNKIMIDIQEKGDSLVNEVMIDKHVPDVPSALKDAQRQHKETLQKQSEKLEVKTILIKEKVKTFQLVDRYTELTIISDVRHRELVEHELLARGRDHEEWRQKQLRRELEKIRTDKLFHSSFSRGGLFSQMKEFYKRSDAGTFTGTSAVVSGVAGIGKTTMVQKIVHDWATGKIYPHFHFVFILKFRDLNARNIRLTLRQLILDEYPYLSYVLDELWKHPERLLFIFDGLDEFRGSIDFADSWREAESQSRCTDPGFWCDVSEIVYSLIQKKLLPGCSVLVTSRPTALQLLAKAQVSVWAEILGFVGEERKEYFHKFFEDQEVAAAVYSHVEENELLLTMCYNPSYCWILALSLGPFFTRTHSNKQRVPKTVTQLFSYYIYNILSHHSVKMESPRDVMLKIGEMAFAGVSQRNIVFNEEDLMKYNLQPSQFLSGFLMELVERESSEHSVVYTFPHLTIQEFVAALAQFLPQNPGNLRNLLNKAHSKADGRFEIFLRFVAGLSSPRAAQPLEEFLGPFVHQTTCAVIDWLKEKVKAQIRDTDTVTAKRKLLNTLHYLFESQNQALAQLSLGSVHTLTFGDLSPENALRLTPIDCVVVSQAIGLCDTIKQLNLMNCYIQEEGLQRLVPALHKCQELL
ncbi:NACHT, LRR and PYD domains-containing protein 3-like isoform X1 [Callorhinchus milii]|uniref:NACHT, LRR and PYD domains-containing protein 3-like isoform X1 n=3 Tax=Callorhinchus milii TaxID=7868 RepID=UPI001C3F5280|nr:NACHT, LRR and PYD domains-containing protein 3-like isoform X1 [Callorhinchus milii]XP_042201982.1 NACHT, LRR and PYD domains-containing protein 3-like isoform X1 [Callorhinchus milii]XP_042201983.1 NACHT, LRR and PYD domains-containing protein 3-like isoform X1 [Callorhinchus milii]XP_042201984.1 NACHT, LRR and PYD domains-containing protein 3-like isoform X1 [Callorhinchus milii]XP_042201985.1 NACHT, LRR and PYD domains-containing protein 3-like isoform X1 [Callorhinchus milii]